jgi:ComF family protein
VSEPGLLRQSRRITQQLLDIVFPPRCAGCQKSGAVLCTPCRATFRAEGIQCCRRCGKPLPVTGLCQHCRAYQPALSGLLAVSNYQGALRSCIHALKYDGNTRLAEPLGEVLAEAYLAFGMQADVIISVPLHHERQQQRGYNHAHLLAEVCASHIHVPLRDDIVVRHRATSAQVGMKAHERQQNVAGAFDCVDAFKAGPLHGRTLLIIDDVYTTGATLGACAAPLFTAGAQAVWGLVLARPA